MKIDILLVESVLSMLFWLWGFEKIFCCFWSNFPLFYDVSTFTISVFVIGYFLSRLPGER